MDFGIKAKLEWFNLDPDLTFTNHGSYGSAPKKIFEEKIKLQYEMEKSPDKWFRIQSFDLWNQNISSLAKYLKVDKENVLICENATEAINSILKAIQFEASKDAILATDYTYQAVLNSIEYTAKYRLSENQQINVTKVPIKFPINSVEQMLQIFDDECRLINQNKNLKLVVLDHISSATAMKFPIAEISKIIRKWNKDSIILVDGAHAIGQTEIDIENFDCDFYVSNLHKWFLCPRGCSFLYMKDKQKYERTLQPCYISHGYNRDLSYNFYQRGTADKTSWFLIDNCIDFYENILGGLNNVTRYNSELLEKAVKLLVEGWQTKTLEIPKEMEAPFMKMIELPKMKNYVVKDNAEAVCVQLMKDILFRFNIISCIVYVQNKLFCRISCFVYNYLDDYVKLKDAVLFLNGSE